MISGAGEAGSKALTSAQTYVQTSMLQAERDKMDLARQQILLDHNAKMQGQKIDAEAVQGEKTRELTRSEGMANRTSHEGIAEKQLTTTTNTANLDRKSKEELAENADQMHRDINNATNRTHLLTAKLTREMQQKQFDKTFTVAKLDALKTTIRELGNEITRLSMVVSTPLADKNDPSHKAAVEQLRHATEMHNLYAKQVGIEANVGEAKIDSAVEKPAPFKMPGMPSSAVPSAAPSVPQAGMVNAVPQTFNKDTKAPTTQAELDDILARIKQAESGQ